MKLVVSTFFAFIASASMAFAACDPFPRSNFIGAFTHDQVSEYVQRAHEGDWAPYIGLLDRNLNALRVQAGKSGKSVIRVRGENVELTSAQLNRFIYVSEQFRNVAACLAEQQEIAKLNEFETAAGGADTLLGGTSVAALANPMATAVNLAAPNGSANNSNLRVQITPECVNGGIVFRVFNRGEPWPDTGMFTLFRIDGPNRQMIGARRLTLGDGEVREFKVSQRQNRTGHVGISIDPSWYSRTFQMDADVHCN